VPAQEKAGWDVLCCAQGARDRPLRADLNRTPGEPRTHENNNRIFVGKRWAFSWKAGVGWPKENP
jgi:hypothetical protein